MSFTAPVKSTLMRFVRPWKAYLSMLWRLDATLKSRSVMLAQFKKLPVRMLTTLASNVHGGIGAVTNVESSTINGGIHHVTNYAS